MKPREQTGLQNLSPITTGLGKKQSTVIPRLGLAEGANKQTVGLGIGVQIEKEIVSQTTETGLMTTQRPIGESLGLDGIELMDIPISSGFNIGASNGSSTLIFSSESVEKGEGRSAKVKSAKGNAIAGGGRGRGRKRDTEKLLLVLGKRRTTDNGWEAANLESEIGDGNGRGNRHERDSTDADKVEMASREWPPTPQ